MAVLDRPEAAEVVPAETIEGLFVAVRAELDALDAQLRAAGRAFELAQAAHHPAAPPELNDRALAFIQPVLTELESSSERELEQQLATARSAAADRVEAAQREADRLLQAAQRSVAEAARRSTQAYRPRHDALAAPAPEAAPDVAVDVDEHIRFEPRADLADAVERFAPTTNGAAPAVLRPIETARTLPASPLVETPEPRDDAEAAFFAVLSDTVDAAPAAKARKGPRGGIVVELAVGVVLVVLLIVLTLSIIG